MDVVDRLHRDALGVLERFTRIETGSIEHRAAITDPNMHTALPASATPVEHRVAPSTRFWDDLTP